MTNHDTQTETASDSDESSVTTDQKTPVETLDPEIEPEVVGFHSGADAEQCENYTGEYVEDVERCENEATHTCVYYDGVLHELAMCDDCGEPDEVEGGRRWSA